MVCLATLVHLCFEALQRFHHEMGYRFSDSTHDQKEVPMKRQLRITVLSLLAVLSLLTTAVPASAGLLYSNGPPNGPYTAGRSTVALP